jgi:hypothetical protein
LFVLLLDIVLFVLLLDIVLFVLLLDIVLFVLLLDIVLFVLLRFTASDYLFGIFKLATDDKLPLLASYWPLRAIDLSELLAFRSYWPSGAIGLPELLPSPLPDFSGVRVARCLFFCVMFCTSFFVILSFVFGHFIACPSIYGV